LAEEKAAVRCETSTGRTMTLVAADGVRKPNGWRLSGGERWRSGTKMHKTDQVLLRAVVVIGRKQRPLEMSLD
jgi:hypothetical protein